MQILTLAAARHHLRIGDEISDEQLQPIVSAAEAALFDHLGRPLEGEGSWPSVDDVPANVIHAIKLVLTDLYENRCTPLEDMTSVNNLVGRYMVLSVG